ncbi:MAG: FHA domain-containing protein, partial [Deltaproteobacteria bacterium]|nr:FHA domain-containing protein [Deltaproteobacteria bacterium]
FCDLARTNGSWLNGVQVHPDHLRLLRDADIVQVGDIRLHVQLPRAGEVASSLLIFSGERFEDEFIFTDDQTQCIVGGPDSHVSPGGDDSGEDMSFAVSRENGRLDLNTGDGERVSVNGMVVQGVTALVDRDEIVVGHLRIVVNDIASARPAVRAADLIASEVAPRASGLMTRPKGDDAWESEAARRKFTSGRRFVFGQEPEAGDLLDENATVMARLPSGISGGGVEMSISQRLPTAGGPEEDPATVQFGRVMMALGLVLVILLLGLLGFVLMVAT